MKGFITSKKGLVLLATLVVAAAAAVGGYAYFTNSGSGSDSSTQVGSVTNDLGVAITPDAGNATLYPTLADSANKVVDSYAVAVTNNDEAAEHVSQIEYTITTDKTGCTQADFSINGGATGATSDVPFDADLAPNSDGSPADELDDTATVQMIDTGSLQDDCQHATVTLHAAVS